MTKKFLNCNLKMIKELLCLLVLIVCIEAATYKYTSRYDHIDLDQVLNNNRLLKSYYNCMIGVGACTPEARKLKKYFPEILQTKCGKCTPHQKKKVKRAIEFLMKNKPDMWEGLMKKYDPTRELVKNMLSDPNFLMAKAR